MVCWASLMPLLHLFSVLGVVLAIVLDSTPAQAFPHSIGHGYTSCLNCHFNPMGGGPLTDYGRAVGATAFAAVPFYAKSKGNTPEEVDEYLGQTSGFLGGTKLPAWIRPGANYRGLYLQQAVGSNSPISRWITMQAEANLVLKTKKDGLIAVGRLGYIPTPERVSRAQQTAAKNLISREHYIGSRLSRSFGIYAGMMDPAFGIRVPDHAAYLRSKTLLNQSDQTHGLLMHYGGGSSDLALHVMTGNLYQTSGLRMRGVSGMGEWDIGKESRWGVSGFATANDYRTRNMGALHTRLGFEGDGAFLGQVGFIREDPENQVAQMGGYFFGQYQAPLARGISAMMTSEFYTADFERQAERKFRAGPSIQYLPMQRVELRVDLLGTRSTGAGILNADNFTLQSQVHVWL
jgi:hypothetical protein